MNYRIKFFSYSIIFFSILISINNSNAMQKSKNSTLIKHFIGFASEKKLEDVKSFLKENKNFDINIQDEKGNGLLHYACKEVNQPLVNFLIRKNIDINVKNKKGFTPLHIAALKMSIPIIKLLISNEANIESKSNEGKTPFDLTFSENFKTKYSKFIKKFSGIDKDPLNDFLDYLSRTNPKKALLLNLLKKKNVKKCVIIIDEQDNINNAAMNIDLLALILEKNPIIINKRLLLFTLISAYDIPQTPPPLNPEEDSMKKLPRQYQMLKTPKSTLVALMFTSILKNNYFFSNWDIYSKTKTDDYILLIPKNKKPEKLGFSKEMKINKKIMNLVKNKDTSTLKNEFKKTKPGKFNVNKMSQIRQMFSSEGWIFFLIGHGGYKSSISGMQNNIFVNDFLKFCIEVAKPYALFISSCYSGGSNLPIIQELIKNKLLQTSFPIIILSNVDEPTFSPETRLMNKEEILNKKNYSKKESQLFPFQININREKFLNDVSKLFSKNTTLPLKKLITKISKLIKTLYPELILHQESFASFLLPYTDTIMGLNDLNDVQFISPIDIKKKLFESKYVLNTKPIINIINKKFAIIEESNIPIELKITANIPVFLLTKRKPKQYKNTYTFESISIENNKEIQKLFKKKQNTKNILRYFVEKIFFANSEKRDLSKVFNKKQIIIKNLNLNNFLIIKNILINQNTGLVSYKDSVSSKKTTFNILKKSKIKILTEGLSKQFLEEVLNGDLYNIKRLLSEGANINYRGPYELTPLHLLIKKDTPEIEILNFLLKKGAKVNTKSSNNRTPLHLACMNHNPNLEVVRTLLNKKANVNAKDNNKQTPLHKICKKSYSKEKLEILKLLIKNGANANLKDSTGLTPLHYAINKNNIEFIKTLTKKINPEVIKKIFLPYAKSKKANKKVINFLLKININQ